MTSYCRRPANFAAHERPTIGDTKFSFTDFNHMGWLKCDGSLLNKSEYALLYNVIGGSFGTETATHFRLPDPQGRVIGMIGSHVDSNSGATFIRTKGELDGAETHTLTINQMPTHRHGDADVSGNTDGNGYTTINGQHNHVADSNGEHNHGVTDPGHVHGYVNQIGDQNTDNAFATETAADQVDYNQTTGSSTTGISINSNGQHTHYIQSNGDHRHQMFKTGGSNLHNNMQPTLFYGNMFIYCGKVNDGSFPYTFETDLH